MAQEPSEIKTQGKLSIPASTSVPWRGDRVAHVHTFQVQVPGKSPPGLSFQIPPGFPVKQSSLALGHGRVLGSGTLWARERMGLGFQVEQFWLFMTSLGGLEFGLCGSLRELGGNEMGESLKGLPSEATLGPAGCCFLSSCIRCHQN